MKVIQLNDEQAMSLWDAVLLLRGCPNILVSICQKEIGMTDEFTREEFFEALSKPDILRGEA